MKNNKGKKEIQLTSNWLSYNEVVLEFGGYGCGGKGGVDGKLMVGQYCWEQVNWFR